VKLSRREALKSVLVGGGTMAGASMVGMKFSKTSLTIGGKETVPVLSPDGKLYHVLKEQMEEAPIHQVGNDVVRKGIPGRKWVMVIDLARCAGLKKCTSACNSMHFTDRNWIQVFEMKDADTTAPYYFPKPCFHCDNPPCTKVCPVGATFKRQDGIVLIDNTRCIGCRFCMAACPYSTRHFNWGAPSQPEEVHEMQYSPERGFNARKGTVEKCDFCPDLAEQGLLPHCSQACPNGTIFYGDANEDAVTNSLGETYRLSDLLKERAGYRFMEELGTEPRVYYLPPKDRRFAPPDIKTPIVNPSNQTEGWPNEQPVREHTPVGDRR